MVSLRYEGLDAKNDSAVSIATAVPFAGLAAEDLPPPPAPNIPSLARG
jgi:hypothetical protein